MSLAHPTHGHGDGGPAAIRTRHSPHRAGQVAALAGGIAETDAQEFPASIPAYAADIAGETRKALDALRSDPMYRQRYVRFMTLLSGSGSAPSPPGAHPRWSCRDRRAWSEWRP